jgi:uncharacterized protein YxjI
MNSSESFAGTGPQDAGGSINRLQSLTAFRIRQRITPMVNRYEIREIAPDGSHGPVLALAQQKRLALKEQVTFYADEARTQPVFGFRARNVMDVSGTTDVFDAAGSQLGTFSKNFTASLLISTWHLDQPGHPRITGVERSLPIALIRRFVFEALPYHFDFKTPDGEVAISVVKKFSWGRDSYDVFVPHVGLDRRLVAAIALALDALQAR